MIMIKFDPRWRHHIETFSALLAICVGNSPVTGKFPAQMPVSLVIWDAIVLIMMLLQCFTSIGQPKPNDYIYA